ncbi:MAG: peptidoglycan glycosyltransferase, partial [Lachnospiraceae bacterium]|nr:peptidoglycan glycosyltransferase [Lachnospiraceae bacterium]
PEEYQEYTTYFVKMLRSNEILSSENVEDDEYHAAWTNESLSARDYLYHAIEQNWIDITKITEQGKYVDTDEIYRSLVDYIISVLENDENFEKMVYHYAILDDTITGNELCLILFDQEVLPPDDVTKAGLSDGSIGAYSFLKEKIKNLEITPGQLALDPCAGSCVVMDVDTGEVLACVSYPGYDNNRLSHTDNNYFAYLNLNSARPLYNYATQQRTAPGSTFKLCTSVAGIAEGVIDPTTEIQDLGKFDKVSNEPRCWIYPGNHGLINMEEAIQVSCNYYFYEVGYRLSGSTNYSDARGIEKLTKYAQGFGLHENTGVEIEEYTSTLADEYPVMAAIGQSNHNITTISLARYVAAVANHGTVYNLTLLDHVTDSNDNVIETYSPTVYNQVDVLDEYEWNTINNGMHMVTENMDAFKDFPIEIAGKTGTAQEVSNRPDHALFVGYAPYDNPKIAIASRIAYGYASTNVADMSKNVIGLYYNVDSSTQLLGTGAITNVSTSTVRTD